MAGFARQNEIDRQAVALYGFGFYSAWVFFSLHGTFVEDGLAPAQASMFFSFFSPVAIAVVLVVIGVLHRPAMKVLGRPSVAMVCTAAALVGSLAMVSVPRGEMLRHVASLEAHILFDVLMIFWLKAFTDFELEIIVKKLPGILTVAGLATAMLFLAPRQVGYALFCLMPLLQVAAMFYAQKTSIAAPLSTAPASTAVLVRVLSFATLFCLASGILLALTRFWNETNGLTAMFYTFFLGEVGVAVVLMAAVGFGQSFAHRKAFSHSFSYMPLVSIVLCAAVFVAALVLPFQRVVLSSMGLAAYNLLFMVAFLVTARHYRCSVLQLFAFGRAVYSVASALSNLFVLGLLQSTRLNAQHIELFILVLACQIVVVIGFLVFIVNRDDAREAQKALAAEAAVEEPAARPSAISRMADEYQLSERETEVLAQLVKGRSIKRVGEELFISMGTVNTYLRRIYQKMDIHSRQELLDRFDDVLQNSRQTL